MKSSPVLGLVLAVVTAAALALGGCGGAPRSTASTVAAADDAAVVADALAARRAEAIARLHAYRVAGVYPTDDLGRPLAVFRDAKGVRCPMSELIYQSGRADLVDAVVRTDNRLRLAEVHDGPLLAWMRASGLTQEEIIEIQGVMEINVGPQLRWDGPAGELVIRDARGQVDAKLVAAERMLNVQTPTSLATAAARLTPAERARVVAGRGAAPRPTRTAQAK